MPPEPIVYDPPPDPPAENSGLELDAEASSQEEDPSDGDQEA